MTAMESPRGMGDVQAVWCRKCREYITVEQFPADQKMVEFRKHLKACEGKR